MALIGISGKIGSGKDTIGKIIQYLSIADLKGLKHLLTKDEKPVTIEQHFDWFLERDKRNVIETPFEIKKFADTLKDQICSLIGCTREQLENQDFKNTELGEEWWYYKIPNGTLPIILPRGYYPNQKDNDMCEKRYLIKPTPRMLLQQIGTNLFRNQLHPNVWVNALFSKYIGDNVFTVTESDGMSGTQELVYPNWIITDMRFPNELEAVKDRSGITIRVERHVDENNKPIIRENEHESETALDDTGFDYLIHNNGSIQTLIYEVKEILTLEKII